MDEEIADDIRGSGKSNKNSYTNSNFLIVVDPIIDPKKI
jgi:hypothetical protein